MKQVSNFGSELRCKEARLDGLFNHHRVDVSGNTFINGKCVNPKVGEYKEGADGIYRSMQIGENYTPVSNPLPTVIKV
tara:strand:- start:2855 stop:3088 length:234 start_codon:yes stop_codon:yes gene_type:complete